MMAGLVVTRRSAHAVTDAKGRFRIEGVESGRRRIKVWHVLGDEVSVEAEVPAGGVVQVEIPWKPRTGFRASFGR
jgi:Ser-tRNA(Ala) deacylase AlaX